MKKNANKIFTAIALIFAVGAIVLSFINVNFSADEKTNSLINGSLVRLFAGVAAIAAIVITGYGDALKIKRENFLKNILWCLPCLLVAVANFPFTAILSGSAVVERVDLIPLLILNCLAIAVMEEAIFRGIIHTCIFEKFKQKEWGKVISVIISSAVFALWHLFNLFEGASVPATLLQVGYSFLTGAMFAAVFIQTENIWTGVILHAVFDFGGFIIAELGSGTFWDAGFWIATAVCGIICTVHVCLFLFGKKNKTDAENSTETSNN